MQAQDSGEQDVELPRFDLLKRANVEVREFGEPFLRQFFCASLAPEIGSEAGQIDFFSFRG